MSRPARARGFTLLEVITAVLIFGVVAALAVSAFGRTRPRQRLNGFSVELQALLFGARQTALTTGHPVVLMIFPHYQAHPSEPRGRLVLYEDGDGDFFTDAAGINFGDYDPKDPKAGPGSQVLEVIDLPAEVEVGPLWGQGAGAAMPAPLDGIAIATPCSFCTGDDDRGAIVFGPLGTATFHDRNGPALPLPKGGSFSVTMMDKDTGYSWPVATDPAVAPDGRGVRTFVVAAANGAVRALYKDPQQ